jgi:hypothetical protein
MYSGPVPRPQLLATCLLFVEGLIRVQGSVAQMVSSTSSTDTWLDQPTMTGDWGGARSDLVALGIDPHAHLTSESAGTQQVARNRPCDPRNKSLISAFNPGRKDPNLHADQVRGTTSILKAVKAASVKRVLWVGGAGGLLVKPGVRVIDAPDFPAAITPGSLATIEALDQLRREPSLDWS